jgi:hypothetical protein
MRKEITAILLGFAVTFLALFVILFFGSIIYISTKHIDLSLIISCLFIGGIFGALFTIGFYSFIFNKDK